MKRKKESGLAFIDVYCANINGKICSTHKREIFMGVFPRNLWRGNFKIERGLNFFSEDMKEVLFEAKAHKSAIMYSLI
jgi:hypothetical protein